MHPDFKVLSRIEEQLLAARLDAVRASISHAGEKGRDLERHVHKMLREILPPEYGLTTGFVASRFEDGVISLSPQLDIIIYDAIRHSPLIHLESCDVLPIESIYGYVEVKASLTSSSDAAQVPAGNSIEACIANNVTMRSLNQREYNVTIEGSPIHVDRVRVGWLAPRAYVIAFEPDGVVAADADKLAARMAEVLRKNRKAHLHGVLIVGHGFYYTRPVNVRTASDEDYSHVLYTTDHPLLAFKTILLHGLATFQRAPEGWAPALDSYLGQQGQWREMSHAVK
jgi:hypothetical protein